MLNRLVMYAVARRTIDEHLSERADAGRDRA